MAEETHVNFRDYLAELIEKRYEISKELLGLESRMLKLEKNDLTKHLQTGNAVLGFSRPRTTRSSRMATKPDPKMMVFSNSSLTTRIACELSKRAEKIQKQKKGKKRVPSALARLVPESSSDTDPETVGIAGLEAAASRDTELRAAHKKQYEATHHMKTRSQT